MVAAILPRAPEVDDGVEGRFVLHQVPWAAYVMLRGADDVVPDLDLALLSRYVRPGESHTALARAFRAAVADE